MKDLGFAETKDDRAFFAFAATSNALAFGALFATVEAARQGPAGFVFQTGFGTWAAFAVGAILGLVIWQIVSQTPPGRGALVIRATVLLLFFGGLGTFLSPLRFLKRETLIEVCEGLGTATIALTCLALIFWRIMRALDSDTVENTTATTPPGARSIAPPAHVSLAGHAHQP